MLIEHGTDNSFSRRGTFYRCYCSLGRGVVLVVESANCLFYRNVFDLDVLRVRLAFECDCPEEWSVECSCLSALYIYHVFIVLLTSPFLTPLLLNLFSTPQPSTNPPAPYTHTLSFISSRRRSLRPSRRRRKQHPNKKRSRGLLVMPTTPNKRRKHKLHC